MTGRAASNGYRVGIDLGGTATRVVLTTSHGESVEERVFATSADPARALPELVGAVRAVVRRRELATIGIGASGPVDRDGIIRNPETLPAFTGVDVRGALRADFRIPVSIDNDAVAAAVYEAREGASAGAASTLMVTLGTGVGVAVLHHGRPVRGGDGEHPEAGHRAVTGVHAPCYCGRVACWEQVVSRAALQRAALQLPDADPDPMTALESAAVQARAGAAEAAAMFDAFGRALGEGLADLETVFRVDAVAIGGSAARYGDLILPATERAFTAIDVYRPHPPIRFSRAGDLGGAIGAALLDPAWYSGEA